MHIPAGEPTLTLTIAAAFSRPKAPLLLARYAPCGDHDAFAAGRRTARCHTVAREHRGDALADAPGTVRTSASTEGPAPESATASSAGSSSARISASPGTQRRGTAGAAGRASLAQQRRAARRPMPRQQRRVLDVVHRVGARSSARAASRAPRGRQRDLRHDDHRSTGGGAKRATISPSSLSDATTAPPTRRRARCRDGPRARRPRASRSSAGRALDQPRADRHAERAAAALPPSPGPSGIALSTSTASGGGSGAMRSIARTISPRKPSCVGACAHRDRTGARRTASSTRRGGHAQIEGQATASKPAPRLALVAGAETLNWVTPHDTRAPHEAADDRPSSTPRMMALANGAALVVARRRPCP